MVRVEMFMSKEVQNNQATKVLLQEEFYKLHKTQQALDFKNSINRTNKKQKCQKVNSMCKIPNIAPLTNYVSIIASLKKIKSFATQWIEELQRSKDIHSIPLIKREVSIFENKLAIEAFLMQPQHSIITYKDSFSTRLDPASQHCMLMQVMSNKATKMIEVQPSNWLRLINELEIFLLIASSNLSQLLIAFSKDYKPKLGMSVSNNEEICMNAKYKIEECRKKKVGNMVLSMVAASSSCLESDD